MSWFYGALGVFVAMAYPALSWPVALILLLMDLREREKRTG